MEPSWNYVILYYIISYYIIYYIILYYILYYIILYYITYYYIILHIILYYIIYYIILYYILYYIIYYIILYYIYIFYSQYNISPRYVLLIFSHPWMPQNRSIRSPEATPCPSQETCCRSHHSRFGPVHSPQWRTRTVTGT